MNQRLLVGSLLSFLYNNLISHVPSRTIRKAYLRWYLGGFGAGTSVQMTCRFLNGRKVFLGERNVINYGCVFDGRRYSVRTGNDVSIGPEAAILTLGHDPQSSDFADKGGEVRIGDRVWIAYRAIILPGIEIGEGAVVAAGSVVTRDVAPFSIVAGVPARPVGARAQNLAYSLYCAPFVT
jgi:maltose O-acetyltransferase